MASEDLQQLGRRYASSFGKSLNRKKDHRLKILNDLTEIIFCFRRSTVSDTDLLGSVEGEVDKWTGAFAHSGSSVLHHRRHTSEISRYLGDRASTTIRRGGRTILFRGWFEMRPGGRSSRADNGSRRRYREDAAISGGREADEEMTG